MNLHTQIKKFLLCIPFILISLNAQSHTKSESYSNWIIGKSNVISIITIPLHEVTRLPYVKNKDVTYEEAFQMHANESISVFNNDEPCNLDNSQVLNAMDGFVRLELIFGCQPKSIMKINYRAIFEFSPSHTHYAKVYKDDILMSELLVNNATNIWQIDTSQQLNENKNLVSFFVLGINHIIGGYDHLAFLFGVLLVAGSIRRSIIAVTGFTIGHSLSLIGSTIGLIEANAKIVEAFIGFTIALMAIEYVIKKNPKIESLLIKNFSLILFLIPLLGLIFEIIPLKISLSYFGVCLFTYCYLHTGKFLKNIKINAKNYLLLSITLIFGFIHGLGFAGFLRDSGVVGNNIVKPLLSFNLGLEFGQLCIIALGWLVFSKTKHLINEPLPEISSGALFGIGFYWMILRTFV